MTGHFEYALKLRIDRNRPPHQKDTADIRTTIHIGP